MITTLASALDTGPVLLSIKPSKRETRIVSAEPYIIEVAAKPIDGAANRELLRYLKDTVGPCVITSGSGSRTKRISRARPSPSSSASHRPLR